jgi:hypothetical protein
MKIRVPVLQKTNIWRDPEDQRSFLIRLPSAVQRSAGAV